MIFFMVQPRTLAKIEKTSKSFSCWSSLLMPSLFLFIKYWLFIKFNNKPSKWLPDFVRFLVSSAMPFGCCTMSLNQPISGYYSWVTFNENNYLQMDIDLSISWQNFRSFVAQQNRTYLRSKTKLDCWISSWCHNVF